MATHRDREALSQDGSPGACLTAQKDFADEQARGQKQQADGQTGAALLEQAPELQISEPSAVGEVVVDGGAYQFLRVLRRPPLQVDA